MTQIVRFCLTVIQMETRLLAEGCRLLEKGGFKNTLNGFLFTTAVLWPAILLVMLVIFKLSWLVL